MSESEVFRELALSAMRCASMILGKLPDSAAQTVESATRAGASIRLEFGPLPAFTSATLLLIEREGARHEIGRLELCRDPGHADQALP